VMDAPVPSTAIVDLATVSENATAAAGVATQ
jgi:hypothetical protein